MRKKLHIHILSNKPCTIEGLKFFLIKNIHNKNGVVVSSCNENCNEHLNSVSCTYCNIKWSIEKLAIWFTNKNIYPDILLIDDFDLWDTNSFTDDVKKEMNDSIVSLSKSLNINNGESEIKIIILTRCNNALVLRYQINFGTWNIIHITSPKERLVEALNELSKGNAYIDPAINKIIIEYQKYLGEHSINKLTSCQLKILYEVSNGWKNQRIAEKLFITVDAVEKHKANIEHILNIKALELGHFSFKHKDEIEYLLKFPNVHSKK